MNPKLPDNTPPLALADDHVQLVDDSGTRSLSLTEHGPWQEARPVAAQSDFERRAVSRQTLPPRTAKSTNVQRLLNDLVRRISKSRVLQASFVLLFAGAIALIWFTANHRVILIDGAYTALVERGMLETELLEKNREWSSERMQSLRDSVASADRRRVFLDYATLAEWLRGERDVARAMNLTFSYTLTKHDVSRMENVDEATVAIRVNVPPDHDPSAYPDLMRFMREMIKTPWYVEIIDAGIASDERGARELQAQLRVWVHDRVSDDE